MNGLIDVTLILAVVVAVCSFIPSVYPRAADTTVVKRSITQDLANPCGLNTSEPPALSVDFKQKIRNMKERAEGLKIDSRDVQNTIEKRKLLTGLFLDFVKNPPTEDEFYFEEGNVSKTDALTRYSISHPDETLLSHANLVSEMVLHIDYALNNGDLGVYGDQVLVQQVRSLKADFKDLLCDIHIALRSRGSELVPFFTELNNDFVNGVPPGLLYEYARTYLFMNDSKRLAGFLHDMYEHMEFYLPAN